MVSGELTHDIHTSPAILEILILKTQKSVALRSLQLRSYPSSFAVLFWPAATAQTLLKQQNNATKPEAS